MFSLSMLRLKAWGNTSGMFICQVPVSRGTSMTWTSLIAADTLYIPYVGEQIMILSRPGLQNTLMTASMASSLPTPQNKLSGFSVPGCFACLFRRSQINCFNGR